MEEMIIKLAGRGYGWYLALKIGKAMLLPVVIVAYPVLLLIAIAWCVLAEAAREFISCICGIPADWHELVVRRKWFTGFSRSYYESLDHYKPKCAETEEGR